MGEKGAGPAPAREVPARQGGRSATRRRDDKKEVKGWAYRLQRVVTYLPHIRIPNAKPLQGRCQDKHNDKRGSRARPCSEAILTEPYGATVGCAFYVDSGFRGYRGTGLISVPVNYGEQVRKMPLEVRTSAAGCFSSFTDPFTVSKRPITPRRGRKPSPTPGPVFFPAVCYPIRPSTSEAEPLQLRPEVTEHRQRPQRHEPPGPSAFRTIPTKSRARVGHVHLHQVNPVIPGIVTHDDIRHSFERQAAVGNDHAIAKFGKRATAGLQQ